MGKSGWKTCVTHAFLKLVMEDHHKESMTISWLLSGHLAGHLLCASTGLFQAMKSSLFLFFFFHKKMCVINAYTSPMACFDKFEFSFR